MVRRQQLISIKGAMREWQLTRKQVSAVIILGHLQPVIPPTTRDRRYRWYSRARLLRAIQRWYPQLLRAS